MHNERFIAGSPPCRWNKWESTALLAFIMLSFTTPWSALANGFLYFGVFPLLVRRIIKSDFHFGTLIIGPLFLLSFVAALNFISPNVPVDKSLQSLRWAFTSAVFIFSTYHVSRYWSCNPEFFSRLILGISCLISVISLSIYFSQGGHPGRLSGTGFMHHPIVGPAGLICIWGTAFLLLFSRRKFRNIDLVILLSSIVLVGAVLFFSQSRGPILSYSLLLILSFIFSLFCLNKKNRIILTIGVVIVLAIVGLAVSSPIINHMIERGTSYRLDIYLAVLTSPPDSLLIGIGSQGDFTQSPAGLSLQESIGSPIKHPHNLFLSVYYQSGIFALLGLLSLLACLLRSIISRGTEIPISRFPALLFFSVVLLLNTTDGSGIVDRPSPEWMFFWFPYAVISGIFAKPKL